VESGAAGINDVITGSATERRHDEPVSEDGGWSAWRARTTRPAGLLGDCRVLENAATAADETASFT
jgi:hypothetical protein